MRSLPTFIIAIVTCILLFVLAWRNGRTYCNTVCPVGTVLGLLSKYALLRPVIDPKKCTSCSLCARKCKASCIDYKNHEIDRSRCVACMDCLDTCKHGAISYTRRRERTAVQSSKTEEQNPSRRHFLTGVALLLGTAAAKAQEKNVDGGLAVILDKKIPRRTTPLAPPGAGSLRNMNRHCTGCQLCVSSARTGCCALPLGWKRLCSRNLLMSAVIVVPNVRNVRKFARPERSDGFRPKKSQLYRSAMPYG